MTAVYEFQLKHNIVSSQYQAGAGSWGPTTRAKFFEIYPETNYRVFRPNDIISKAEATKILMRMADVRAVNPVPLAYIDVSTSWHIPYVES